MKNKAYVFNGINISAFEKWFILKRDRGYKYAVIWTENGEPRVMFTKEYTDAVLKCAGVGGMVSDLITMQKVI